MVKSHDQAQKRALFTSLGQMHMHARFPSVAAAVLRVSNSRSNYHFVHILSALTVLVTSGAAFYHSSAIRLHKVNTSRLSASSYYCIRHSLL